MKVKRQKEEKEVVFLPLKNDAAAAAARKKTATV